MNRIFTIIIFFILTSIPGYSSEKIVYLDVEKIMQSSLAGKSIATQLKKKKKEKKKK